ncbi:DUF4149 domain-containing protein [Balneolaceae bacterium YR4-1]|uniref:DUF4149 domain-containing protein n=1 Tax=Halalkalibaculum roseum TaxID=2709311 RepID=A0A6M1SSE8_9BACT|nr:DUF4149 domain-containing protein [Halalkalibaculum roseum]NGP75106.1 DUF4149 domain-containing protein [Halalkalibaculum roseum]
MLYYLSVFIHILSAIFWIGGMLFTAAVLVPASRHQLLANKKGQLFTLIGKKFSRISWVLFIVLVLTGITNLLARGYDLSDLATSTFWKGNFGHVLFIKLHLFGAVLVLSSIHDFYAGPRAAELMDSNPKDIKTQIFRKISRWIGRLNLIIGLGILYYAIRLLRG